MVLADKVGMGSFIADKVSMIVLPDKVGMSVFSRQGLYGCFYQTRLV